MFLLASCMSSLEKQTKKKRFFDLAMQHVGS